MEKKERSQVNLHNQGLGGCELQREGGLILRSKATVSSKRSEDWRRGFKNGCAGLWMEFLFMLFFFLNGVTFDCPSAKIKPKETP